MSSFTRPTQKLWEAIPSEMRMKILNSVWCGHCRDTVTMLNIAGNVEKMDIVLTGRCGFCGNSVGRLIESE